MSASNTSTVEASQNSDENLNPTEAVKVITEMGKCLQKYVETSFHKGKTSLLSRLSDNGDLCHCALTSEHGEGITHGSLLKFALFLFVYGYFNNITKALQCKRDVSLPEPKGALTLSRLQNNFPEFANCVISSLLKIKYVEKKHLYITASLTWAFGRGTKHPDMMKYLVRLIFSFSLSTGKMKKHFVFYHPKYNDGRGEGIEVNSHDFIVIDHKSGGVDDTDFEHQAIITDSNIVVITVSIAGEDLPNRNASQFLEDLDAVTGGKMFRKLDFA